MFGPLQQISKEILNWTGAAVALCLLALLGFLAWALIFVAIPMDNREPIVLLLGIVSATINQVVGFFFGTSYGSQKKTEAIERLTKGGPS